MSLIFVNINMKLARMKNIMYENLICGWLATFVVIIFLLILLFNVVQKLGLSDHTFY